MKPFELKDRAQKSDAGEYVFGAEDTGSHACYMIYGIVKPGEKKRLIRPGKGHEEMVLAMKGDFEVTGAFTGRLTEGSVFHISGDTSVFFENTGAREAIYIIAGGHSDHHHHH